MAIASAQGFADRVLAQGNPPLTESMVNQVIRCQEVLLKLTMKPEHRKRMQAAIATDWNNPDGKMRESVGGLMEILPQFNQLDSRTRELAVQANLLQFLTQLDRDAKAGDPTSVIMLEAYKEVHKPIHPQAPLFTAHIADAYLDAFFFAGEVQSGKPAPKPSQAGRIEGRKRLAADFVKMTAKQRTDMSERMAKITTYRIQWPQLNEIERLSVRAEMGGRLSMEEQQLLQQYRHMVQSHSIKMLSSELNHMRANQQMIMGSAPYFNPATQRWEQIGGIVTEFR